MNTLIKCSKIATFQEKIIQIFQIANHASVLLNKFLETLNSQRNALIQKKQKLELECNDFNWTALLISATFISKAFMPAALIHNYVQASQVNDYIKYDKEMQTIEKVLADLDIKDV